MERRRTIDEYPSRFVAFRFLLPASWTAFACSVFFRPNRGEFNAWLDVGLYNVPFGIAAAAFLLRSRWTAENAKGWRTLGTGLIFFIMGNLYDILVVGDQEIFASPADAMWLAFYLVAYVAIVLLVRRRVTRFHRSSWLDGGVGGLGVAATTLAYPTADIILIVNLVTAGAALHRLDSSFSLLIAGFAVFTLTDVIYLFEQSAGTYSEGGVLDLGWALAAIGIGFAACVRIRVRWSTVESGRVSSFRSPSRRPRSDSSPSASATRSRPLPSPSPCQHSSSHGRRSPAPGRRTPIPPSRPRRFAPRKDRR